MKQYGRIIRKFKDVSILTIGDVMLDKYVWGSVNRISPEAPVQVVEVRKETYIPGGAANVANNVSALSGRARVIGVVGSDETGRILKSEIVSRGIDPIFIEEDRPTISKMRVIGQNQQLLRLDYEMKHPIEPGTRKKIIKYMEEIAAQVDCIILSDYAKGLITRELVENIIEIAGRENKKVLVDPKPRNMKLYAGVDLITPNHKEAGEYTGIEEITPEDHLKIGRKMVKALSANILITRGEKGMSLFEKNGRITHIPTRAKQVYDVTGAGDTVVAVTAMALAGGADYTDASAIANYSAGVVVGKIGTATLNLEELKSTLRDNDQY